jgi:ABC-type transporter Mla maintaining outer membrane lipid asymmetry permease subunit MlaE
VVVGDVAAALAAIVVAHHQLDLPGGSCLQGMIENSSAYDLAVGMGKGLVIGLVVSVIAAFAGLGARPGIQGIAAATNRAAVFSFISATLLNFMLSHVAYSS